MTELSLGISPCPNDVFIFSGLILNEIKIKDVTLKFSFLDIESLNVQAQIKALDIIKISYANYLRCADDYDLLTTGGALGRGVGPLLLTNGGHWQENNAVAVPGLYTTANFLLDFWAQRKLTKKFSPFDVLYNDLKKTKGSQGVVIHEKRFTYQADGLTLVADLGTHWEKETGYPIPLGCLISRKGLPAEEITEGIQNSLRWAYENHDRAFKLCKEYSADLMPAVIQSHIDLYVNDFSLDVGKVGTEAVNFFFQQQRN